MATVRATHRRFWFHSTASHRCDSDPIERRCAHPRRWPPLVEISYRAGGNNNIVTPVVSRDLLILSGYQMGIEARRIERSNGRWTTERIWHQPQLWMFLSTPVIVRDRLYGYSDTKRGRFFCLDSRSGEIVWTSPGRQAGHASLIGTPKAVLALKESGELLIFQTGVRELEVLADYTVADGETWAYPALVDGRLIIVKGTDSLNAWSVPSVG